MSPPEAKQINLQDLSVDQLVERFTGLALAQDKALLGENIPRVNQLFDSIEEAKSELQGREGDQRRALVRLYDHPNPQVRLKAVKATLAVDPAAARRMLQIIADSRQCARGGCASPTASAELAAGKRDLVRQPQQHRGHDPREGSGNPRSRCALRCALARRPR